MIASIQFKGLVVFDKHDFGKSKLQLQMLRGKDWRPVFEITAQDMMKLFNKKPKINKRKGKR